MAVYTHITREDLDSFFENYSKGTVLSYKAIAEGVENSNYWVETTEDRFILTLYEKRVAEKDLPFFLDLMDFLKAGGLECPLPIRGKDHQALRKLCGRPAAVISFLNGKSCTNIAPSHCLQVGQALATLHQIGKDFPKVRENNFSLTGWRLLFEQVKDQADPKLVALIKTELEFLHENWPQDLARGIIHGDLFPDNVFFEGANFSGMIDFYFACTDFLIYDLAICLNAWCFEQDHSFNPEKAKALIAGYESTFGMTAQEKQALTILCRGAALRFLLTRLYDWIHTPSGALVHKKDPLEYVRKLQFHQESVF
jgi:homoserine kinase type II